MTGHGLSVWILTVLASLYCTRVLVYPSILKDCYENSCYNTSCLEPDDPSLQHAFQCMCDKECDLYGDCCHDYQHVCQKQQENEDLQKNHFLLQQFYPYMNCTHITNNKENRDILLIGRCPSDYPADEIRRRCQNTSIHPLSKVPVTILFNNLSFVNVYCARCHGMNVVDYNSILWNAEFECRQLYGSSVSFESMLHSFRSSMCFENVEIPITVKLRRCLPNLIKQHCPVHQIWTNTNSSQTELISQCMKYQRLVIDEENIVYKNPHCAGCIDGHINVTEVFKSENHCSQYSPSRHVGSWPNVGFQAIKQPKVKLHFNFDPLGTSLRFKNMILIPVMKSCERLDEVYDSAFDVCTKLICPNELIAFNGSCVCHRNSLISNILRELQREKLQRRIIDYRLKLSKITNDTVTDLFSLSTIVSDCVIFNIKNASLRSLTNYSDANQAPMMSQEPNTTVRHKLQFEQEQGFTSNCSVSRLANFIHKVLLDSNFEDVGEIVTASLTSNAPCITVTKTAELDEENNQYTLDNKGATFQIRIFPSIHKTVDVCDDGLLPPNCTSVRYEDGKYSLENNSLLIIETSEVISQTQFVVHQNMAYVCRNVSRYYSISPFERFFKNRSSLTLACITTSISIFACFLTLIVYGTLPQLRNCPGKIVMSLTASLFSGQLGTLVLAFANGTVCRFIAPIAHWNWLSVFLWKTVMAVDIARTVRISRKIGTSDNKMYLYYVAFAWILPAADIGTTIVLDQLDLFDAGYGFPVSGRCLIMDPNIAMYTIGFPMLICITVNVVCCVITVVALIPKAKLLGHVNLVYRKQQMTKMIIKLSFLTGGTWIFLFLANFINSDWIMYINVILNGLSGLYLFASFVCNRRVLTALQERVHLKSRSPSLDTSTNRTI